MVSIPIFFLFDFAEDLWRASVVRNRWVPDPSLAGGGFWDGRFFTDPAPTNEELQRFVDQQIERAQLTVVLIGTRTAECPHVQYAIRRSVELGRGLLGIYVDQCRNRYGRTGARGRNPFDEVIVVRDGREESLAESVPVYDWVDDDGFANLPDWIDQAKERVTAG
jgi:hypothetical protein